MFVCVCMFVFVIYLLTFFFYFFFFKKWLLFDPPMLMMIWLCYVTRKIKCGREYFVWKRERERGCLCANVITLMMEKKVSDHKENFLFDSWIFFSSFFTFFDFFFYSRFFDSLSLSLSIIDLLLMLMSVS